MLPASALGARGPPRAPEFQPVHPGSALEHLPRHPTVRASPSHCTHRVAASSL